MVLKSRIAILERKYTIQGDGIILSPRDYKDVILYSDTFECDVTFKCTDGTSYGTAVLNSIINVWDSIISNLKELRATDVAMIQIQFKEFSYTLPIPDEYYRTKKSNMFDLAFRLMGGGSSLKVPALTKECCKDLHLDSLAYFLVKFMTGAVNDVYTGVRDGILDFTGFSDNLKSPVLTKHWLQCLHEVIKDERETSIYTYAIPTELVDECADFCIERGYDRLVYMFLQEHPCRLSESKLNEVISWRNARQGV